MSYVATDIVDLIEYHIVLVQHDERVITADLATIDAIERLGPTALRQQIEW